MRRKIVLYTIFILLILGCEHQQSSLKLAEVDSLVSVEMYDSAYQKLLEIKQDFRDNEEMRAHFCLLMTQTTLLTDHPLTSDSLINIAISYYEKNANEKKLSDAYYYKANYLLQQKDYAQAIILCKKAYELANKSNDYEVQYKVASSISYINCLNGNYDLQLEYAQKALDYALKTKRKKWIGYVYNDVNIAFQYQGNLDSATVYAEKAISFLDDINQKDLPYFLNSIGYAYMLNNPEKAKEFFRKSISIKPLSRTLENLAYIYKTEGNERKAYELWQNALANDDEIPVDKIIYNVLQYNLSHNDLDGACEQLSRLVSIKDSIKTTLSDRSIQQIQQKYDEEVSADKHEKEILIWSIAVLLLTIIAIILIGYIRYKKYKNAIIFKEHQLLISSYMHEIDRIKNYSEHLQLTHHEAELQIADLNQKIKDLMEQESPKLAKGKLLYDQIQQNGTTVAWANDDYKCFIEFYKTTHFASYSEIMEKYSPKTAHNTFFLILYEIGKEDKDIRQIMGITQEAIRSTRFRIQKHLSNVCK